MYSKPNSLNLSEKYTYIQARRKWGGAVPPLFGRSANPISTRGGTLSSPSATCPGPEFSDLASALTYMY